MQRPIIALLTALCLASCALPVAVTEAPPTVEAQPVAPEPSAEPTVSPNMTGRVLTDACSSLAGATLTATLLGEKAPVASAVVDPDGGFGLVLPETVKAGALIQLLATQDGRSVTTLVGAPAARQAQAEATIVLTEATTLAVLMLAPRFKALAQASRGANGDITPSVVWQRFRPLTR